VLLLDGDSVEGREVDWAGGDDEAMEEDRECLPPRIGPTLEAWLSIELRLCSGTYSPPSLAPLAAAAA
jgi:hypothetical protein